MAKITSQSLLNRKNKQCHFAFTLFLYDNMKYFYIEKYYEEQRNFRNKFESIWSLGIFSNDLFTLLFLISCF
jgi:hypothetical protein